MKRSAFCAGLKDHTDNKRLKIGDQRQQIQNKSNKFYSILSCDKEWMTQNGSHLKLIKIEICGDRMGIIRWSKSSNRFRVDIMTKNGNNNDNLKVEGTVSSPKQILFNDILTMCIIAQDSTYIEIYQWNRHKFIKQSRSIKETSFDTEIVSIKYFCKGNYIAIITERGKVYKIDILNEYNNYIDNERGDILDLCCEIDKAFGNILLSSKQIRIYNPKSITFDYIDDIKIDDYQNVDDIQIDHTKNKMLIVETNLNKKIRLFDIKKAPKHITTTPTLLTFSFNTKNKFIKKGDELRCKEICSININKDELNIHKFVNNKLICYNDKQVIIYRIINDTQQIQQALSRGNGSSRNEILNDDVAGIIASFLDNMAQKLIITFNKKEVKKKRKIITFKRNQDKENEKNSVIIDGINENNSSQVIVSNDSDCLQIDIDYDDMFRDSPSIIIRKMIDIEYIIYA